MKLGTLVRIKNPSEAQAKFAELRSYGFESCQLSYKPAVHDLSEAPIIRAAADAEGIEISAMSAGYNDGYTVWDNYLGFLTAGFNIEATRMSRMEYSKHAMEFAQALGITDVFIHAGYIPNNPFSSEYASMLAAIDHLSRHAQRLGINILFETGGESPVSLLRLIQDIGRDNLFVNLDPANFLMYGFGNPVDALYTIGKYVRNIHGKDGMPPTDPRKLGREMPVGEGLVDFRAMFTKLHELGYDRFITIEREIAGDQQTADILKAKAYFEQLLAEIYV
ncbi:MAG: sugar phosphate isomerase/epimerase [Clostridia bacterium]|nr:sugar phosphate isomerase/epimerase [Clostridia bacterium]